MIIIKRNLLTFLIILSFSTFLFSQEKNTHFTYELLPSVNNVNAQFLENYNKGIFHYNKAINMIKAKDNDLTLEDLSAVQEESLVEFKQALPYFEKAYSIAPKDELVLKGLNGIYFALNETEEADKYRKEYESLHKK